MRDEERFDIDEDQIRAAVQAAVREQIMALTGRLDAGTRPRRSTSVPGPGDTLEVIGWEPTLSSPWQAWKQANFTYAAQEWAFRRLIRDNSALEELRRSQAAQARG